ncbi:glycine cleavage system protein GcvH [Dysgonomonas sp. HDW5A]|uniref:glycine cleavage system protein GcvH n=1 Tax=unclassified Dysgonomonas TaxID=2630389 RepID=UPI00140E476D|nr:MULTISPECIES: glycine cleavage system protein GcvH [unclassified Dysgonomonas]QIK52992.1 glycine cleavage system protein GcvH [Dysgonomonas sp. HDW5B]QIK58410.1 glycine cleavage system protein GcvH [Dysgonomonas sp. HDW5A]
MSKVIEGLLYTDSHEWVKVEGEYAYIGITDFAQHQLGNIVYVDIPEVGDEIKQGEEFGAVESVKAASDLLSPVSGEIVEVNEKLTDEPELINKNAFDSWMLKVKLSDAAELKSLMDSKAYAEICD